MMHCVRIDPMLCRFYISPGIYYQCMSRSKFDWLESVELTVSGILLWKYHWHIQMLLCIMWRTLFSPVSNPHNIGHYGACCVGPGDLICNDGVSGTPLLKPFSLCRGLKHPSIHFTLPRTIFSICSRYFGVVLNVASLRWLCWPANHLFSSVAYCIRFFGVNNMY